MALIACYECGSEISTAATACPKCGAPNKVQVKPQAPQETAKTKPKTRPVFKVLAIVLLGFFLVALFSNPDRPTQTASQTEPEISVEAEKLSADYKANEVAADNKYKGKRLLVTGTVESINKDFKDEVWVGLATDNQFMPIHAEGFAPQQVSGLKKGSVIKIPCTGAGMIVGSPFLKDCG